MRCQKCNGELPAGAKFCTECGSEIAEPVKKKTDPVTKNEKAIKNAGVSLAAFGWFTMVLNLAYTLFVVLSAEAPLNGGSLLLILAVVILGSIAQVYLGNRIKTLKEKNTKIYIGVAFALLITQGIIIVSTGGGVGILFFLLAAYLVSAWSAIRRLEKLGRTSLSENNYKLAWGEWGSIALGFLGIVAIGMALSSNAGIPEAPAAPVASNSLATATTAPSSDPREWKVYRSLIGKFAIKFPTEPQYESQTIDISERSTAELHTYTSEVSTDEAYLVQAAVYPSEVNTSNPEANLEGALNGIVNSNRGNVLLSSESVTFSDYPAVRYQIKHADGYYITGLVVLVDHTIYFLQRASADAAPSDNFEYFLSSFELL